MTQNFHKYTSPNQLPQAYLSDIAPEEFAFTLLKRTRSARLRRLAMFMITDDVGLLLLHHRSYKSN